MELGFGSNATSPQNGFDCQRTVIKAIEQYVDRHNINNNISENGVHDLRTLQYCSPRLLVQGINVLIQLLKVHLRVV